MRIEECSLIVIISELLCIRISKLWSRRFCFVCLLIISVIIIIIIQLWLWTPSLSSPCE